MSESASFTALYNRRHILMQHSTPTSPIRIAAAVTSSADGCILLVKKRHTAFFMQPGGKLEGGKPRSRHLRANFAKN
jgi:hypothetical protein